MEIRTYTSSYDEGQKLSAEFYVPDSPKPLALFFHGWHMRASGSRVYVEEIAKAGYFVVNVDMRGRGESTGKPDANGFELLDGLEALDFARRTWREAVDSSSGPYVVGGSGGGGNTLALVGKAPDQFAAAVSWAGMSDYALWHQDDERGRYRDEMETKGWIGGTPETNPEGYLSRGGLTVVGNAISPIIVFHGKRDGAVLVRHATKYKERADELGKDNVKLALNDKGHDSIEWSQAFEFLAQYRQPPRLPSQGKFLLASFLVTHAFRLIADSPAVMGEVSYQLDRKGRLISLSFSRPGRTTPMKEMILELPDGSGIKTIQAKRDGQRVDLPPPEEKHGRVRYHLRGSAPWDLEIVYK